MIPADKLGYYMSTRTIEIAPLAYMRGRTLDNAFIILDEAQNTNDLQLKMFLTRMAPMPKPSLPVTQHKWICREICAAAWKNQPAI